MKNIIYKSILLVIITSNIFSCDNRIIIERITKNDEFIQLVSKLFDKRVIDIEKSEIASEGNNIVYIVYLKGRVSMSISNFKEKVIFHHPEIYKYKKYKIYQEKDYEKEPGFFTVHTNVWTGRYGIYFRMITPMNYNKRFTKKDEEYMFTKPDPEKKAVEYMEKIIDFLSEIK
jgi:hypothetical protein